MATPHTDDIEKILRERISRHEILPGTKLRERPLTEEFNVSRARIRQAFAFLEQRGLIERIPNQGAIVSKLKASELFEIYDVFELLEGLCVRLAVQKSHPTSWDDLAEIFGEELDFAVAEGDCETLFKAIMVYRSRVREAAKNPTLDTFLDSIYDKTQAIIQRTLILPGRAELSLKEHRDIIAAMRQGQAEKAEELKLNNMRSARQFLERYHVFLL